MSAGIETSMYMQCKESMCILDENIDGLYHGFNVGFEIGGDDFVLIFGSIEFENPSKGLLDGGLLPTGLDFLGSDLAFCWVVIE